jgi:hypothetical protein
VPQPKSDRDLLAELLAKGYGAEERRDRRARRQAVARKNAAAAEKRASAVGDGAALRRSTQSERTPEPENAQRMEDRLGPLSSAMRRRIDRYAWRNGFLATGVRERVRSILTVFFPGLEDWASVPLVRELVGLRGDPGDPATCSLLDALVLLGTSARALLAADRAARAARAGAIRRPGEERVAERVASSMRAREPFLLPLLSRLAAPDEMAVRALEFTRLAYRRGDRIRVRSLVRPARSVFHLALATDALETDVVARLMTTAAEVARQHEPDAAGRRRIEGAAAAIQVLLGRLRDFRHELFPILLKCMAVHFPEEALWDETRSRLVDDYVGLGAGDTLDYHGDLERRRHATPGREAEAPDEPRTPGAEAANAETQAAGIAVGKEPPAGGPAEAPVADDSVRRLAGALELLRTLFPGSGIHRLRQYHFVLPYFDLNVFNKDLTFPASAQLLARNDPMAQIMVLHRIIDNLISSIDPIALTEVLAPTGASRGGMPDLARRWKEAYPTLFDPYLKQLEDYARVMELDRHSPAARRMEDTLNRIRNYAVRRFGRIVVGGGRLDITASPLYALSEDLLAECRAIDAVVNERLYLEKNRQTVAVLESMAARNVIDLELNLYKPTIERLRRLIETRMGTTIDRARPRAMLLFFDFLSQVAVLYDWLLGDERSFFRAPPEGPFHAGLEERRRWAAAREAAGRGAGDARPVAASATPESWADEAGKRLDALKKAGRVALVVADLAGRDVLEGEGEPGVLAFAAAAAAGCGDSAAAVTGIGRDRLVATLPRATQAAVAWAGRWRDRTAESLKRHPLYGEVIEQKGASGLAGLAGLAVLVAGIADVSDSAGPREALARAEAALQAAAASARAGGASLAVWTEGAVVGYEDYLSRVARRPG